MSEYLLYHRCKEDSKAQLTTTKIEEMQCDANGHGHLARRIDISLQHYYPLTYISHIAD